MFVYGFGNYLVFLEIVCAPTTLNQLKTVIADP